MNKKIITLVSLITLLTACASPVTEQERTGFISDYSGLEKTGDSSFEFEGNKIGEYSTFLVDKPVILFDRNEAYAGGNFTKEELDDLLEYYHQHLIEALTDDDGYALTEQAGPGVARIKSAITAVDETVGALNVTIYTKVTGAGLGGAAMEGEILDSITNEQLAAVVQWGNGSRILRAGFTKLGDAKIQIDKWTKGLRKSIDKAHGK